MTTTAQGSPDAASDFLVRAGRFFTPGEVSPDSRTITKVGGREGDVFYRDRWSHDKVVRSTHGVNCTGSCSWNIHVKDGIVTWEMQALDYPALEAGIPPYEPRGCQRGISFSWYLYSPLRVKYPYMRGALLDLWRKARAKHDDPVAAWRSMVEDPEQRSRWQRATMISRSRLTTGSA